MTEIIRHRQLDVLIGLKDRKVNRNKEVIRSQSKCEDVAKFLHRIGLQPNVKEKGFHYLYTAILTCMEYIPGHLTIEKVYRYVADHNNTTMRDVEREIDVALKTVSNTSECIQWKKEILGQYANKQLRNSQTIVFMARYLK